MNGALLAQTRDTAMVGREALQVVTKRAPTHQELDDLMFAWQVCKFVKSNGIVFARGGATVGIGAGQMDAAILQGITAVIQPGGSKRDVEVIAAADENELAMVFTGMRHFRH